jgi:hypothetical protein
LLGAGANILFKGSGFYQTDYRSESYRKQAKAEAGGGETAKKDSTGKPVAHTPAKSADGAAKSADGSAKTADKSSA